jgi:excisionase family DNA binding protein
MLDSTIKGRNIGLAMSSQPVVLRNLQPNGCSPNPVFDPEDRLLTVPKAAELSGVDSGFIRRAIAGRELRVVILGPKTHRVRLGELQRWWKSKQTRGFVLPY